MLGTGNKGVDASIPSYGDMVLSGTLYIGIVVRFLTSLMKLEADVMSAPCSTAVSASRFSIPPTPSGIPFPCPASKKFHVPIINEQGLCC